MIKTQSWTPESLLAAELELERDAIETARRRYREACQSQGLGSMAPGQELVRRGIDSMIAEIEALIETAYSGNAAKGVSNARFLSQYEADELAFVALRVVVDAVGIAGRTASAVAMDIVRDLEAVDLTERLRAANLQVYERFCRFAKRHTNPQYRLAIMKRHASYVGSFGPTAKFKWDDSSRLRVGHTLLEMAVRATGIATIERTGTKGNGHAIYTIVPTEEAVRWIDHAQDLACLRRPLVYPMVVKPLPWTSLRGGGYLMDTRGMRRDLIRATGGYRQEMDVINMPLVYEAINAIQETPWQINRRVLDTVKQAVSEQLLIQGLPDHLTRIEEPLRPEFFDTVKYEDMTEDQRNVLNDWKRKMSLAKAARNVQTSRRLAVSAVLEVAEKMAEFPAIYYPHTMDWRGRAYPVSATLNPQGSDLCKGLLRFSEGKPLGPHGQRWLVIHLANAFGVDKVSFNARVAWVTQNFTRLLLDAEDPVRPDAIWMKADSPFVALAAIFELADLSTWVAEGNSPSTFVSHIPVSIDGSCNGLQHYSAMLRDEVGGAAVNLVPSDAPSDIYSIVAEGVRKSIEWDLNSDDEETRQFAAFWNQVGITRKWAKRNTMTLPYGVTQRGMADQLWDEIGGDGGSVSFFEGHDGLKRGPLVRYLARKNWEVTGKVVVAAREGMEWLQAVVKAVNRTKGGSIPMSWVTPDGLPVIQAYHQTELIEVRMVGVTMRLHLRKHIDKIDSRKQVTGIAPNFVHSIDAAHMRAVVRTMREEGIKAFAMVHDSFGVHAGHVEHLVDVTREAFINLHSEDLLGALADRVADIVGDNMPPMPARGTLDLNRVANSLYFFA